MISIDDFNKDNSKIANLILKYGLEKETIWFIELQEPEAIEQIKEFSKKGFQIGSHTMTHAFLSEVTPEQAKWEMYESKWQLEEITGKKIEWLCLPRGRGNEEVYKMAFDLGYNFIRTTKLTDDDKYDCVKGGLHLSYPRSEYEGKDPFTMVKDYTHYWGHCFEIDKFNLWDKFEEFLKWYKENNGNI